MTGLLSSLSALLPMQGELAGILVLSLFVDGVKPFLSRISLPQRSRSAFA